MAHKRTMWHSLPRLCLSLLAGFIVLLPGCGESQSPGAPLLAFGRTGIGACEFNYPRAGVIGPDQLLYIIDKGGRLQVLTQAGEYVRAWYMPECTAGRPCGLAAAADGRIFTADTHYARITVFSPEGRELKRFGAYGDGPGQFHLPTDVAIDKDGFIYVSEYGGNDRIQKFDAQWNYVASFGGVDSGEARLQRPQTLLIDVDGTIWVADSCNHRIVHFTRDGKLLGHFGSLGAAPGELRFPYGIDRLSDGTLVVAEYGNNRVQRFSPSGKSLGTWGIAGRALGELAYPWAVVVGADDHVFVVDSGNNRIQVLDGTSADTWTQVHGATK